jgi:uncharacterized membrane protein
MSKTPAIVIGAICAIYIALRFWGLTDSCLWFDEIFGIHAAEHSFSGLFWFVAQDLIHPPLFYVLLKFWMALGGDGLLWLRLFPVMFSVFAIFPFLQLCKELQLKTMAVSVALGLFAVNGALIKYAQEVRMYSLFLFLSLMSFWLFSRYFIKGKSFAALTIVNVLLVYTHYFGWLAVGSEFVAILVFQRIKIRQTLLMFGITFVLFVPWMIAVYRAASSGSSVGQNIGWIERPGISAIFTFLFDLIEPFYFQMNSAEPGSLYYISIPILLLIGVAKIAYLFQWLSLEEKKNTYLLEVMIGFPISMALIASWLLPYSVWGSRHLIIVFAPLIILTAIFLTEMKNAIAQRVILGAAGALILISFGIYAASPTQEQPWCTWEKAAETLAQTETMVPNTTTPVYAFEDLSAYHLWFALRKYPNYGVLKVEGIVGVAEDTAYFLPRGFDGVKKIAIAAAPKTRSFMVFRQSHFDPDGPPVSSFTDRGFEYGKPTAFRAVGSETFLLEIQ